MIPRAACLVVLFFALCLTAAAQTARAPASQTAKVEFFEKKVRPVLANHCYNCHSANTNSKGGLRVDDRNGLVIGGGRGAAIVPGHPEKSLLMQAVKQTHDKVKMPLAPAKRLSVEQSSDLAQWI